MRRCTLAQLPPACAARTFHHAAPHLDLHVAGVKVLHDSQALRRGGKAGGRVGGRVLGRRQPAHLRWAGGWGVGRRQVGRRGGGGWGAGGGRVAGGRAGGRVEKWGTCGACSQLRAVAAWDAGCRAGRAPRGTAAEAEPGAGQESNSESGTWIQNLIRFSPGPGSSRCSRTWASPPPPRGPPPAGGNIPRIRGNIFGE